MDSLEKLAIVGVVFAVLSLGYTVYRGEYPKSPYEELTPQAKEWLNRLKKYG